VVTQSPHRGSDLGRPVAAADYILVGSGINSLVAAAFLARAGHQVYVCDRNDWAGGAIKTEGLTLPGYRHDVFSAWHPLFVASEAYRLLGPELRERGLEYLHADLPTATVQSDGGTAFLHTTAAANIEQFERYAPGDGDAWRRSMERLDQKAALALGLLSSEPWSARGALVAANAGRRLGIQGLAAATGEMMITARDWLTSTFTSERVHSLLAPWGLHAGLGPDAAASGFMTQLIGSSLESIGVPVPRGGADRLVDALVGIIEGCGGTVELCCEVDSIVHRAGRATGVRLTGGRTVEAQHGVLANVTPTQLYGRLLRDAPVPDSLLQAAQDYRYGRAGMQIHMALSAQPAWIADPRLANTAIVHMTPSLDGVSQAVNEADRNLLPAEGTIVCGQPTAADPSRAPAGGAILWIQILDLPARPRGDAAGELDVKDGHWNEELREAYADRIQARLGDQIANLDEVLLQRVVLSPPDLEAANPNLVGGDIFSGSLAMDQNLLWRPSPSFPGHRTMLDGLYHIGASTHPGPGLGAGSGTIVARELLSRSARSRMRRVVARRPRHARRHAPGDA
jgi:phytoene dehydrogenase-like protein